MYLWRTFRLDGFRFDSTETIINSHRDDTSSAQQVLTWFRHLMGLRNNPDNGLRGADGQIAHTGNKTLAFSRAGGRFFIVATFGTGDQQQDLGWLGLPGGSAYKEVFNSTWPEYRVHQEPQIDNGGYAAQLSSGSLVHLPSIGAVGPTAALIADTAKASFVLKQQAQPCAGRQAPQDDFHDAGKFFLNRRWATGCAFG